MPEPEAESRAVLAQAATVDLRWLVQYGARTGSTWARDVFAFRITDGALDADGLRAALLDAERDAPLVEPDRALGEGGRRDPSRWAPTSAPLVEPDRALGEGGRRDRSRWAPTPPIEYDGMLLVDYARMLASGRDAGDPVVRAHLDPVLDHLAARVAAKTAWLKPNRKLVLAELFARSGRTDDMLLALERRPDDGDVRARLMQADAANPWLDRPPPSRGEPPDRDRWLTLVNRWCDGTGFAPLGLAGDGPTPFDRLSASVAPATGGPLVSVLMTCFRPGAETLTAARSIVAQTWPDWELIVLDDASGPAYDDVLAQVAALDDRIRVVRAETNAGTYVRRNQGLALAHGELVTMQDSDDWSHPQRLAHQVRHLDEHPELPANWLSGLRCSERLELVNDRTGRVSLSPAEPTLMVRRSAVERIGGWDPIRRAADREFRERIEAVFGVAVPDVGPEVPLLMYRVLSTSLSSPDFVGNWVHPARLAYRSAFEHWHRAIAAGADPHLPTPSGERAFPAPARFTGAPAERHEVDVLVLLDVRPEAGPPGLLDAVVGEVGVLLESGTTVGLAHLESLAPIATQGVLPEALESLVQAGRVARVLLDPGSSEVKTIADRVVVRSASALQGQPAVRLPVTARRVVVVDDRVSGRDRPGETYAAGDVQTAARAMFGVEAEAVEVVVAADALALGTAYAG